MRKPGGEEWCLACWMTKVRTLGPGPQRATSIENISSLRAGTLSVLFSDDFSAPAWYLAHSRGSINIYCKVSEGKKSAN